MCYCDADMPEFFAETFRKARRDHHCCECGGIIAKGVRYQENSGKWDGYIQSYRRCIHCYDTDRLMVWHSKQTDGCYCTVFTGLRDAVYDEWREGGSRLMGRKPAQMGRCTTAPI